MMMGIDNHVITVDYLKIIVVGHLIINHLAGRPDQTMVVKHWQGRLDA